MEADWAVEIGAGLPVMEVPWQDWVDLRGAQDRVLQIPSAAEQPALAATLIALNAEGSPWFTSKCDFWWVAPEEIDPYEFDATDLAGAPLTACACYLDLVACDGTVMGSFERQQAWLRKLVSSLREIADLEHCRVDLVLREAVVHGAQGFGCTAYVAGCGAEESSAVRAWESAVAEFARTVLGSRL